MTEKLNIFNIVLGRVNILLLSLIVFLIPIFHTYLSPLIGLWAISGVIMIIRTKQPITKQKSQLALIGFYLLLVVGLFWTKNLKAGAFDLEVKMSLIIFPLLFLFLNYSKSYIRFVVHAFILGILVGSLYLFYQSFLLFKLNYAIDSFFYVNLSTLIHPSYLSFYVVTAIMILLVDLKSKVLKLFKSDLITVSLIFLLLLFNIFLLSRVGVFVGLLFVLFFTIEWTINKRKYLLGIAITLIVLSTAYMSYKKSPYVKQRLNELIVGVNATEGDASNGSTGIRLKIWGEALVLIKEQPIFGYGTGDVKDVLMSQYKLKGVEAAYEKKLNAHNQFLQIGVGLGVLGLILFILVYYLGIINGLKNNNYFSIGFIIISILFMLPESVLENQAGTIFFGLFLSLLNQKVLFKK